MAFAVFPIPRCGIFFNEHPGNVKQTTIFSSEKVPGYDLCHRERGLGLTSSVAVVGAAYIDYQAFALRWVLTAASVPELGACD